MPPLTDVAGRARAAEATAAIVAALLARAMGRTALHANTGFARETGWTDAARAAASVRATLKPGAVRLTLICTMPGLAVGPVRASAAHSAATVRATRLAEAIGFAGTGDANAVLAALAVGATAATTAAAVIATGQSGAVGHALVLLDAVVAIAIGPELALVVAVQLGTVGRVDLVVLAPDEVLTVAEACVGDIATSTLAHTDTGLAGLAGSAGTAASAAAISTALFAVAIGCTATLALAGLAGFPGGTRAAGAAAAIVTTLHAAALRNATSIAVLWICPTRVCATVGTAIVEFVLCVPTTLLVVGTVNGGYLLVVAILENIAIAAPFVSEAVAVLCLGHALPGLTGLVAGT